jgi:hypothetical protein
LRGADSGVPQTGVFCRYIALFSFQRARRSQRCCRLLGTGSLVYRRRLSLQAAATLFSGGPNCPPRPAGPAPDAPLGAPLCGAGPVLYRSTTSRSSRSRDYSRCCGPPVGFAVQHEPIRYPRAGVRQGGLPPFCQDWVKAAVRSAVPQWRARKPAAGRRT